MSGRRLGSRRANDPAKRSASRLAGVSRPKVELLERRELLARFVVTTTSDGGPNSLRQAIIDANVAGGSDVIDFDIAGSGVHTIDVGGGGLPTITDSLFIDGSSQKGWSDHPLIELNGSSSFAGSIGLNVSAGNSQFKALAINSFKADGLRINASSDTVTYCFIGTDALGVRSLPNGRGLVLNNASNTVIGGVGANISPGNLLAGNTGAGLIINGVGATDNKILGNFIGTSSGGTKGVPNGGDGILINGGSFNQIGGLTAGSANVISGNKGNGITIIGSTAQNNSIWGNFIGTDGSPVGGIGGGSSGGSVAISNGQAGIDIQGGASQTQIGSLNPSGLNVISANGAAGIFIENGPATVIMQNLIGTDVSGTKPLGNLGSGVSVINGDTTVIGGTLEGGANVIAFNGGPQTKLGGVNVQSAGRVAILSNAIFSNFGKGIVLSNGSNNGQVAPKLTLAGSAVGQTKIQGSLNNSLPNSTYTIQFFSNAIPGAGFLGQGQTLIGQSLIKTDAQGNAVINVTYGVPSNPGDYASATATDPNGNTSEFAFDTQVVQANVADITVAISATPNPATLGSSLTYAITVTNNGNDDATNVQLDEVFNGGLNFSLLTSNPPGATYVLNPSTSSIHVDLGTIKNKSSVVLTLVVTPSVVGIATTSGVVSLTEIDTNLSNNAFTAFPTVVNIPADLGISLSSDPASVTVGQNVSILATITNAGPGAADNSTVLINLPSNVSFVAASTTQGTATFSKGVVTAHLGDLERNATQAILIVVTAPMTVPASSSLLISASVSATETDPIPSNNNDTLVIPVIPSTDLALTLTRNPTAALSGQNVTYSYTITNNGPSDATLVNLTDIVPRGVNFIAAPTPSQGSTSFTTDPSGIVTVTAALGTIPAGSTATGTIVLEKDSSGKIDNIVTIAGLEPDADLTNNKVETVTLIDPVDLSIAQPITASPATVSVGSNLTYTILINNAGPAKGTNVVVTDTLPADVTFVSATSSQGTFSQSNGVVTMSLGTLTAGATVPVTIVVVPTKSELLSNSVVVGVDQTETNSNNNTSSVATYVSPADLGVQLSASTLTPLPGDLVTFTAFVTNHSDTFTAAGAVLSDSLPAGLQLVSGTTSQGTGSRGDNSISVQLGSLLPGASATVTIVAKALSSGSFTNSASITSDQVDPDLTNNAAFATVDVNNGPGVIQFASPVFSVGENAGAAVITLVRTGGNLGVVTVHYSTTDGTGINGTNYSSTTGTIVFNDGDLSKSFTIPVLDDGVVNGATSVNIALTNPQGGASLGSSAAATLVIGETDFDLTGPTVLAVQPQGSGKFVTGVILSFSEALDSTRASDPNNYAIYAPTKGGGQAQVGILSPTYNSINHTVTLTSSRPLPLNTFFRVAVNGASATGVADIFDNLMQGASSGNGQNFAATFARGSSLKYTDHDGDFVTLNISNGGILGLSRSANGEAMALTVQGSTSKRSMLSGTVRKGPYNSDGVTTLQSISGVNFARIDSRLRTPNFYVDQVTAFIKGSPGSFNTPILSTKSAAVAAPRVSVAAHHTAKAPAKLFARTFAKHFFPSR